MFTYSYLFTKAIHKSCFYHTENKFVANNVSSGFLLLQTNPKNFFGVKILIHSLGYYLYYDQVWITSDKIDCGLITIDLNYSIFMWNSYYDKSVTITNISTGSLDNVFVENITGYVFKPLNWRYIAIEVKSEGSAILNGYVDFFTDDDIYNPVSVKITGIRLLLLPLYEFISGELRINYKYPVVIVTNYENREQRRLAVDKVKKSISGRFFVDNFNKTQLMTFLEKCGGNVVGLGFLPEPLTSSNDILFGQTEIYFNEDFSEYDELFNVDYLLIYDPRNKYITAIEIESIDTANKKITLVQPIQLQFDPKTTLFFPLIACKVLKFSPKTYREGNCFIELEFEEAWLK